MGIKTQIVFIALCLISLTSCKMQTNESEDKAVAENSYSNDYQNILNKGKLKVLAENSSTSYFIYKGKKMGYEYEILREFAKSIGVELEVKIVNNLDSLIPMLESGQGDIIACNYTITRERKEFINFSIPFLYTPQVLVQKLPDDWNNMSEKERKSHLIEDPTDLIQKHVSVWDQSSYYQRLIHLQEEIGDTIYINPVNGFIGGEELIEMVSEGIIDYTIVEENIGKINQSFYDNIDVSTRISFNQKIGFGLRKSSTLLKAKLDKWLTNFLDSRLYSYLDRKYFSGSTIAQQANDTFSSLRGGKISIFDKEFKAAAQKYNSDWRLLASISYQESKFNPYIESFGGAYGMMQFMPNTGPYYGVYPDSPPAAQIMGGMKKLNADLTYWKGIKDEEQRIKFALASYNAGRGHILDAKRLAEKHGLDPNKWDNNVEKMILNLSKQEFYRDEVVRNGAMHGTTTYNYVKHVYARYLEWKSIYE